MSSIKRDVKKKVSPRPDAEKIFVSRSSPLPVSVPSIRSRGFVVACLPYPWLSSSGGDDADRVLKLGKRTSYLSVNHGSIRGSRPLLISCSTTEPNGTQDRCSGTQRGVTSHL